MVDVLGQYEPTTRVNKATDTPINLTDLPPIIGESLSLARIGFQGI